jgi:hypothetical protein
MKDQNQITGMTTLTHFSVHPALISANRGKFHQPINLRSAFCAPLHHLTIIKGDLAMSTFLVALSTWLHVLATIVMIGHYLFLSLIYLPVFERQMQANPCVASLSRSLPASSPFLAARCSFSWSPAPTSC